MDIDKIHRLLDGGLVEELFYGKEEKIVWEWKFEKLHIDVQPADKSRLRLFKVSMVLDLKGDVVIHQTGFTYTALRLDLRMDGEQRKMKMYDTALPNLEDGKDTMRRAMRQTVEAADRMEERYLDDVGLLAREIDFMDHSRSVALLEHQDRRSVDCFYNDYQASGWYHIMENDDGASMVKTRALVEGGTARVVSIKYTSSGESVRQVGRMIRMSKALEDL